MYLYVDVSTNLNLRLILIRRVVECSICLSTPSTLITRCTHVFCGNCIKKWFDHAKKSITCPNCKGLLTSDDMFSERPTIKLEILMQLLSEETSITKSKSVVFSRYDDALYNFILHLRLHRFKCLVYTTKTMIYYKDILKEFENSDRPTVLFVDFQTARRKKILINSEWQSFHVGFL